METHRSRGGHVEDNRPLSAQYAILHVYLIPSEFWRSHLQSAPDEAINHTISLGFIRILPTITVCQLREEMLVQLNGEEILNKEFFFLKCVGRCFTKLKSKQEKELKVKIFLPPQAISPEIYIMETSSFTNTPSSTNTRASSGSSFSPTSTQNNDYYNNNNSLYNNHSNNNNKDKCSDSLNNSSRFGKINDKGSWNLQKNMTIEEDTYFDELDTSKKDLSDKEFSGENINGENISGNIGGNNEMNGINGGGRYGGGKLPRFKEKSVLYSPPLSASPTTMQESDEERMKRLEEEEKKRAQKELEEAMVQQRLLMEQQRLYQQMLDEKERRNRDNNKEKEEMEKRRRMIETIESMRIEREEYEQIKKKLVARQREITTMKNNKGVDTTNAKEMWRKKYFSEKKATIPIEEECQRLRRVLNGLNEKVIVALKQYNKAENTTNKSSNSRFGMLVKGSKSKSEIDSNINEDEANPLYMKGRRSEMVLNQMQEKLQDVGVRLTSEMKLRKQAETDIKTLKKESESRKVKLYQNKRNRNGL